MDNIILILFIVFLITCTGLIIFTLLSLPKLGDERKNAIKMQAQSNTFTVVVMYMLLEVGENIYKVIWGNGTYEGVNPLTFLIVFSTLYLGSLLYYKKKLGG